MEGFQRMISHGKEIAVFTGNSNPALAKDICSSLFISPGNCSISAFADGECSVSVYEPVRGKDVFIVQSTCKPVNDSLMELLIMIDAMRRASAGRVTAVIPYFGYARQDRKAKSRDPISAKLVANLITVAGADRVLTMDLHAAQIQGFFDIPVDNLVGSHLFVKHFTKMFGKGNEDVMVVSPDVGSTARARAFAMKLGVNMAIVDKRRERANQSEVMNIIGNVEGKICILLDDIHTTASSHGRVFVIEIMGHKVGWIPLYAGIAGGADVILLPEIPYDLDKVVKTIERRDQEDHRFTIIVAAEGAISKEDAALPKKKYKKKIAGRTMSVAYEIADDIFQATGREIRVAVPGHIQRGGQPCARDRVFATQVGVEAARGVLAGEYGFMVADKGREIVRVPMSEVAGKLKYIDPNCQLVNQAKTLGIVFGD